jgi:uncharacterized protein YbjT (DUF2867 family)
MIKKSTKMDKKIVTLAGATGYLGEKIAKELVEQGAQVRAIVRSTSNRTRLEKLGITDFVTGDMMDPDSLKKALALTPRADAVIASAAGYTGHTKGDSPRTDTVGYRNLADAAKAAAISRFVLISILECDKAPDVPHFHHKYLAEQYLRETGQPFIALRPGAFLDQAKDYVMKKVPKGIYPAFVPGVSMGMIYTGDLARYAAMAAISLPDSVLGNIVDVGWNQPVSGEDLAKAFSKVLGKKVIAKPAIPGFIVNIVLPAAGIFNPGASDMYAMIKWIRTGVYKSSNTQKQKELFSDLPTVEEAVRRYCRDNKLI